MHGLFLRALQNYVGVTFGAEPLARALAAAGAPAEGFEPLLRHERAMVRRFLGHAAAELGRPVEAVLEDVGTFIIMGDGYAPARRLLRFGGASFGDFLLSIEDLPDRARLALPDDAFPPLDLADQGGGQFRLTAATDCWEIGHVMVGILRAMADDYGALVMIEAEAPGPSTTSVAIRLLDARFAAGRLFDLAGQVAG